MDLNKKMQGIEKDAAKEDAGNLWKIVENVVRRRSRRS
jgi:hypothetical protein